MKTLAKFISSIGNPVVIGLFFGFYIQYFANEGDDGDGLPLLFVSIIIIPLVLYIGYNVYKKNFDDFDVSNQKKRNSVYVVLLIALGLLSLLLIFGGYPVKGTLLALTLFVHILVSFLINQKLKVSKHTSFNFLFAWVFYPISAIIAIMLFFFGFFNAWSRLALARHTKQEVIAGFFLGNVMGASYLIAFNFVV